MLTEMEKYFKIKIDFDDDDWLSKSTASYLPDGVLMGYTLFQIGQHVIFKHYPWGINNSIIIWLNSVLSDHIVPETFKMNYSNPMFYCAGAIKNECGVYADFSIRHRNGNVILSNFYKCKVAEDLTIILPWKNWAKEIYRIGVQVLRKCPPNKLGIKKKYLKRYQKKRKELILLLKKVRVQLKKRI